MNELTTTESKEIQKNHFNETQIEILKNSICKGASNEEFEVFLMACSKTRLDPFMRQIYPIMRKSKNANGQYTQSMTIQTGIDGYRLIAERTGRYSPGQEPTYMYDNNNKIVSATAYVKKQTKDGHWHTVSASAFLDEYCPVNFQGQPTGMWVKMPRTMLAKCAEAQALRKAFPAEMSGIYTKEEMDQADYQDVCLPVTPPQNTDIELKVTPQSEVLEVEKISAYQVVELQNMLDECDKTSQEWFFKALKRQFSIDFLVDIALFNFERIKKVALGLMQDCHSKQKKAYESKIKAV